MLTHNPREVAPPTYRKSAGMEPLPGYTLLEPLGKGGFGEVWKCEAPGGLMKAIKFVANDAEGSAANSLEVEFEAFQHIKTIRHPFLLTLERVELFRNELVMVMELADHQLQDLFRDYTQKGYAGIPRDDLIGYLSDAAEMLDHIGSRHGLQHLDIKPANLFLVCERVKVGDFGLVRRHELSPETLQTDRGMTPRYVAPEILHGRVDPRSDQYCLALVYQEMLTGVFPYNGRSAQQMMLQHASASPNLTPLPVADRTVVGKALSKAPTDRYPSCSDFMRALVTAGVGEETIDPSYSHETWNQNPNHRPVPGSGIFGGGTRYSPPDARHGRSPRSSHNFELPADRSIEGSGGLGVEPGSLTGRMTQQSSGGMQRPELAVQRRPVPTLQGRPAATAEDVLELVSLTTAPPPLRLPRIWSVLPACWLTDPGTGEFTAPECPTLLETLTLSACPNGEMPPHSGVPELQPDGTWTCRFPIRSVSGVSKIKLELLKEAWKAEIEPAGPEEFFIRRYQAGGMWGRLSSKGKSGLIVHVRLPKPGPTLGETVLTGSLFGPPDPGLSRASVDLLPEMLDEVRKVLGQADDRRKHVRLPVDWEATFYPLTSDGVLGKRMAVKVNDVSFGGVSAQATTQPDTAYVYAVFHELKGVANWAILTRLTRANPDGLGYTLAGRFRTDL